MCAPCRKLPAVFVSFSLLALSFGGCRRAGLASLVPSLELRVRAREHQTWRTGDTLRAEQRWDAVASVSLRFRAQRAALATPTRYDLSPETWMAPCDSDDLVCLQEAAEAERELAAALGPLQ